ncbi:MAG: stage III sporulation protein AF [Clostridia bacterium]|nr:stage III sporulation protein AF [Clostridia bacterium]
MVEFLSSWSGQIVVALVIGSLLEMLVPKGKNKKYVKMLIGIYIIFCIVSPFTEINESFSMENIDKTLDKYIKENTKEYGVSSTDADLEELYIKEVEKSITEDLAKIGYKVVKCKIVANLNSKINKSGIQSINIKVKKYVRQEVPSDIDVVEDIEKVNISINTNEEENTTYIQNEDIVVIKNFILDKYEIDENKIHISG